MSGGACRRINAVARGVLLETRRRRDPAVLGILAGAFLVFLAAARLVGFDNPATGTLLLNLSLTLSVGAAHMLTLAVAARQMPDELERGTIHPLLARPLRRAEVLLGKWCGALLAGLTVLTALIIPALLLTPRLEHYDGGVLAQLLLLQPVALAVTAALALALSLGLPRAPGFFLAVLTVFGAGGLKRLLHGLPALHLLPDPGRLNLTLRYTDGIGPLDGPAFAALLLYGFLWTALLLAAAERFFGRRSI